MLGELLAVAVDARGEDRRGLALVGAGGLDRGDRVGVVGAVDQLLHLFGELLLGAHVGVGAAGGVGDAEQLLAGLVVVGQAQGVDHQVDALGGEFAGHVAGVGRGAGVLAVGDQHHPAGGLALAEVLGGAAQRQADRGEAGGPQGRDGGLGLGLVGLPDREELLAVQAALGLVGAGVVGAQGADAELGLGGQGVDDVAQGLLGHRDSRLALDVRLAHGAADIQYEIDPRGLLAGWAG